MTDAIRKPNPIKKIDYILMLAFVLAALGAFLAGLMRPATEDVC